MGIDLTTKYGSLTLKSPVIVGACPLTAEELLRIAMVSAGAGAIVLPSLMEEQVVLWNQRNGHAAGSSLVRENAAFNQAGSQLAACQDAESYLVLVERVCSRRSIPVIASLNGKCASNWLDFAKQLQSVGADGIELHVRHPEPGEYSDPRDVEDSIVEAATILDEGISIPLFLKLGRNYTSLSHLASRLVNHAQGLVLFGRSPTIDIHLDSFQLSTSWGLTESGSIAHSMESIMHVHSFCPDLSLTASGGIGTSSDLIKVLLAGADAAMVTSAIYRDGPTVIGTMLEGLIKFMERNQMQSLVDLKSKRQLVFESEGNRLDYIKALSSHAELGEVHRADPAVQCDRWGHPRAPR